MIAVVFLRGAAWDPARAPEEQYGLRGHIDWVHDLRDRTGGPIIEAGPFHEPNERVADDLVGLALLDIDALDEARRLVETDPVVVTGAFDYRLYPWGDRSLRR